MNERNYTHQSENIKASLLYNVTMQLILVEIAKTDKATHFVCLRLIMNSFILAHLTNWNLEFQTSITYESST